MDIIQIFYDEIATQYDKLFQDWQGTTREQADIFVIMGGRPGQTGTLASSETCACGRILPTGSYESDYEQ